MKRNYIFVPFKYLVRPSNHVFYTSAMWLMPYPKFKIFFPVVSTVAVLMMDILTLHKFTTKHLLHYYTMFKFPPVAARSRDDAYTNVSSTINFTIILNANSRRTFTTARCLRKRAPSFDLTATRSAVSNIDRALTTAAAVTTNTRKTLTSHSDILPSL